MPASPKQPKPYLKPGKGGGQLRIIGGQWRSRRLPVASVPGLRPTPDRVRETLFNWLQNRIAGARCLDLFAGSGALGFEALSRGAAHVTLIEQHPAAFRQLQANARTLQAQGLTLLQRDALHWLLHDGTPPFDLIFLDPPFHRGLLEQVLERIQAHGLLTPNGMIYLEHEAGLALDPQQRGFEWHRQTHAGQVVSGLWQRA
ncbi:MAG TPA: 16S rRNA (guanine(966)-N(2))-methyltransferase RsmD [Thiolinea sp.]|nr:16S rRNA (guanine(966)-N(2))-methyltransferase RsmD [Thiolinea sp.]